MDTKNKKPRKTEIAKCPTLVQVNYESKKDKCLNGNGKNHFKCPPGQKKLPSVYHLVKILQSKKNKTNV